MYIRIVGIVRFVSLVFPIARGEGCSVPKNTFMLMCWENENEVKMCWENEDGKCNVEPRPKRLPQNGPLASSMLFSVYCRYLLFWFNSSLPGRKD